MSMATTEPMPTSAARAPKLVSMATTEPMLKSAAYRRMCGANPSEFVPRSVFFAHDGGSSIDRRNSLWVKAALVYESVTGRHVNDGAKPLATSLLLRLADACRARIPRDPPPQAKASVVLDALKNVLDTDANPGTGTPLSVVAGEGVGRGENQPRKPADLPDEEGSDENKRVIDAIFLVVGFLRRLSKAAAGISRDAVDEGFKSTHMQDIVTDVIKLENQLPLKLVLEVVDHVEDAIRDVALAAAAPASEFEELKECLQGYKLGFTRATFFEDVVRSFCWYYSPFFNKHLPAAAASPKVAVDGQLLDNVADDPETGARTLLDFLHDSVVPVPRAASEKGIGGGKTSRMPTARELSRSGVRIAPGEDGRAAVEFEEASARLRLPALVYDFKLATVARNLLAREFEEQSKPVTRYFQMMNELVGEAADAKILRRAGAVRGGGTSGAEVYELVKRIDGYATYPSVFMAMDVQIEKVRRFHDKRMQNFLVRYRPGVIWASSVAAVSVVAIVAARRNRG